MLNYSIMRLDREYFAEYCDDIERQVRDGITTMPLFCVTLTPEGDPAIDKAELCMQIYEQYKRELDARGVPSGVLIQASIGHGWVLDEASAFQKYVGLRDGRTVEVCCPLDEGFRRYIRRAACRIAAAHPAHIMLDDDFRLIGRPGRGCACPLHLARLEALSGQKLTREGLLEALKRGDTHLRELFIQTQIDSLVECAREIRGGIDEIDPKIPGSFCLCGPAAEGAYEIAEIMAGKGNPIVMRLNNANYCAENPRDIIAKSLLRAAVQRSALTGRPEILLAETDTCPQNRYSTSAAMLHTHYTMTILEGAGGAKHWITRSDYEPGSGEAYRRKLSSHARFYDALARLEPSVVWQGCRIPIPTRPIYELLEDDPRGDKNQGWIGHVLDRMGLPTHFSPSGEGAVFLDGKADACFTDDELRAFLSGRVVLDAASAKCLIARGFGEYLGVQCIERAGDASNASGEITHFGRSSAMYKVHELVPLSDGVREYSEVYHLCDGVRRERLFPGVTAFDNALGGTAVVFSGVTDFTYGLTSAFGFLNETRKRQIVEILSDLGCLPLYYPGDAEAFLKVGRLPDGALLCVLVDLSLDPIENLPLTCDGVRSVRRLNASGELEAVGFESTEGGVRLSLTAYPYDPVVLRIEL